MKTRESNKLIAEFMEVHQIDIDTCRYDLQYHKCWDLLMPVVSKCHKIDESSIRLEIGHKNMYGANIHIVYEAVLEFIKKFNKQNKVDETHQHLREILIKYNNSEYGDCIIDEICNLFEFPMTKEY